MPSVSATRPSRDGAPIAPSLLVLALSGLLTPDVRGGERPPVGIAFSGGGAQCCPPFGNLRGLDEPRVSLDRAERRSDTICDLLRPGL